MTSKLTREQLHERARENVKALKMASRQHAFESAREEILADLQLAELALAVMDSEPVAYTDEEELNFVNDMACMWTKGMGINEVPLYRHAQPAPVVPENCVTAEHRRVIEMLLNVCGAAFELADDSCQQDVDGEECHVVPSDAFQKLSDALDEIENTLPTEDIDRPDVFLAWSAMPRAALKSLLQAGNSPVIPDDSADTKRLDWLDAQNKRLNEYYGTSYGWKFDANFQRNAMMLNDSNYPVMTVRQAIDESIAAAPKQGNI